MSNAQDILKVLETNGWTAMGIIAKKTGLDPSEIRPILKGLVDDGSVDRIGNRRSTRYAIMGLAKPAEGETSNDDVTHEMILDFLNKHKGKPQSRQAMCEAFNTYDIKVRPTLFELIEQGKVAYNGKKRGQLFWPADDEAAADLAAPAPKLEEKPVQAEPDPERTFESCEELVIFGLKQMIPGERMEITELASNVQKHAPQDDREDRFNQWLIIDTTQKLMKAKKLPYLHYERVRGEMGARLQYYVQ